MGRTKQTARKSTGGMMPHRSIELAVAPPSLSLGKGKGVSKEAIVGKGKGGKGLGKGSVKRYTGGHQDDNDDFKSPSVKPSSLPPPPPPAAASSSLGTTALAASVAPAPSAPPVDTAEKTAELIASFAATSSKIDVVFAFDTTGSMYCYLQEVRKRIHESVSRLHRDIPEIRIGILAVGDYCDQTASYVVKSLDLTRDIDSLVRFITGVGPTGGGDAPEAYELALQTTRGLSWEAEPGNRALVMIGDSYPHPPSYTTQSIWWRDELQALVDMGVKVYGVQCNSTIPTRYFYEEMAALSGGGYLSLQATSCITDMFLAVCYRQVSESALEAYVADAEKSGEDIEAKRRLFGQLKSAAPTNSAKRCTADWYDRTYDHGRTAYTISDRQRWVPYLIPPKPSTPVPSTLPRPAAAASPVEPSPIAKPSKRRSVRAK